jgi:1-deoxy-D-xylulose-5-phosphate synthase
LSNVPTIDLTTLNPTVVRHMSRKQLQELADTMRAFLIESVTKTGGHLASNLGTVELSIALTHVFDLDVDTLLYDVGHQTYPHKILTGRASLFSTLRQTDGLSGFPKYSESKYDHFETGHSSTSLSAACGIATSKYLQQDTSDTVAIIGDGALTGGLALEGLNNIVQMPRPVIVVVNDNDMSISENVGAISHVFASKERSSALFTALGYDYIPPVDGHDIAALIDVFQQVKGATKSVIVHVKTIKGYGYTPAQMDKVKYHGIGYYTVEPKPQGIAWSPMIASLVEAKQDVYIITPAMIEGSGLRGIDPSRVVDVGIAEGHAVTMAAAMRRRGTKVFLPIYATFLQRAYDSLVHDVARSQTPVVFGIDRAGTVPGDGDTHQGIFDVSICMAMPQLQLMMPANKAQASALLDYAFAAQVPTAIRYPKGNSIDEGTALSITQPTWLVEQTGSSAIVITYGPDVYAVKAMAAREGLSITIVNALFLNPIDEPRFASLLATQLPIIVYEQVIRSGSLGQALQARSANVVCAMAYDAIPSHGDVAALLQKAHLSMDHLAAEIRRYAT